MIRQMARESIRTPMEQFMSSTGQVLNNGLMDQDTKELMSKAKSMERDASNGLTVLNTQGSSLTITLKEEVCISGLMGEPTKATGPITKCTAKAFSYGPITGNTSDSTSRIRRKAWELWNGTFD